MELEAVLFWEGIQKINSEGGKANADNHHSSVSEGVIEEVNERFQSK